MASVAFSLRAGLEWLQIKMGLWLVDRCEVGQKRVCREVGQNMEW